MVKEIKYEITYILKEIPDILKGMSPCKNCSLSIGLFGCLNRSLCESDKNYIWVIKKSNKIKENK